MTLKQLADAAEQRAENMHALTRLAHAATAACLYESDANLAALSQAMQEVATRFPQVAMRHPEALEPADRAKREAASYALEAMGQAITLLGGFMRVPSGAPTPGVTNRLAAVFAALDMLVENEFTTETGIRKAALDVFRVFRDTAKHAKVPDDPTDDPTPPPDEQRGTDR